METIDIDLVKMHQDEDPEIRALWEQHVEFEKILEKFEGRPYLSPTQTQEIKQLKKKKLAGKTKLQLLLDKYRETED
ncbi:MAG: DUF465 domain-containing protein [Proteobacteria bacterium]|nr:DUF465 domain-containing protein [Pseudomonadota bacterium]MBU1612138.1 DUF465 domain-containing protein [Pseudomonadota bacterium]